jgi:hypothetical protein
VSVRAIKKPLPFMLVLGKSTLVTLRTTGRVRGHNDNVGDSDISRISATSVCSLLARQASLGESSTGLRIHNLQNL